MTNRSRNLQERSQHATVAELNMLPKSGLKLALRWPQLPPEQLEVILKAILQKSESESAREHELRLEQARLAAQNEHDRRTHTLYLGGLIAGFILAAGMITSAVIAGVHGLPWLAAVLSGPSLISLTRVFVLRRIETSSRFGHRQRNTTERQQARLDGHSTI